MLRYQKPGTEKFLRTRKDNDKGCLRVPLTRCMKYAL